MKISQFAKSQGVSIDRANRAAIWALQKTGRSKPKTGGRYGGVDLTEEEQRLCIDYLAGKHKTAQEVQKDSYEGHHLQWLKTWTDAYEKELNVKRKWCQLAVIGALLQAKNREWLDAPFLGASNGDMIVELAYDAMVDWDESQDGTKWIGFTGYLLEQGFESPGWGTF